MGDRTSGSRDAYRDRPGAEDLPDRVQKTRDERQGEILLVPARAQERQSDFGRAKRARAVAIAASLKPS